MRTLVVRVGPFALLFGLWIGYLAYLVWTLPPREINGLPTTLSQPQFLASQLDVVGTFEDNDRSLLGVEILFLETNVGAYPQAESVNAASYVGLLMAENGPLAIGPSAAAPTFTVRGLKIEKVLFQPPGQSTNPMKAGRVLGINFGALRDRLPSKPSTLGPCIVPLKPRLSEWTWDVTPVPASPGYRGGLPRIYPFNADTKAQYRQIPRPRSQDGQEPPEDDQDS